MYRDPDSRADQFDDAFERRQSGEDPPLDDPELQDLLQLADRLERDLPEDLPDPAFRASLKEQLLGGQIETPEPVDFSRERWHRRLAASPWRLSAAAAVFLVVIVVAMMSGVGPLGSDSDGEETVSFQALDDEPELADDVEQPLDVQEMSPRSSQWLAASFPPFDSEHMVLPPLLLDLFSDEIEHEPAVELNGAVEMIHNAEMPETATVYYLSAPPDPETMLMTLRATLNIDGEYEPGSNDEGTPHQVVNEHDEPVMKWDPSAAFFHFRGDLLEEPVADLAEEDADPTEIAARFLDLIGFDLMTIEYEATVVENDSLNEVRFAPTSLPETGLEVRLGGSVFINLDGEIHEARLYWVSLVDTMEVRLRSPEELLEAMENGQGYAPPGSEPDAEMMIDVDEMKLVHVLTRLDEAEFVLQPAVKFMGHYAEGSSELPGPARYLVPAAENGD